MTRKRQCICFALLFALRMLRVECTQLVVDMFNCTFGQNICMGERRAKQSVYTIQAASIRTMVFIALFVIHPYL